MAYPSSIDSFTSPSGTSLVTSPDHAGLHTSVNTAITAIETVVGTTAGTAVLRSFTAGQFPPRMNGSNVLQHSLTGTINSSVLGTPAITGGTINSAVLGTPTVTLGSDATGDMYYRSSGGTVTRVGIGSNGQVLKTNGTTPSWGTVTTSTTAVARAYLNQAQDNIADATFVKVNLNAETFDPGSNFDTANSRFVAPTTGYYSVTGLVSYNNVVADKRYMVAFYKNGVLYSNASFTSANTDSFNATHSDLIQLDAGTGTVELYARVDAGVSTVDLNIGATNTFLNVSLVTT